MNKLFLALVALVCLSSFADARIIHRTFELPAVETGTVGYNGVGNYNKVIASGSLSNLLVGNIAGDGFAGDARGYMIFPTYQIPKRFTILGANVTLKYNSTSSNSPKYLYLTDAIRRVGNNNASQFIWYWNSSKQFNITSTVIGSSVSSSNVSYVLANTTQDVEALKIAGSADMNDNLTLGLLLNKNGLASNTFVKVFGTGSGVDSVPTLVVDTVYDNGRGECANEVTGFRGTRLKKTQNGVSFNATEYRVSASVWVNGVLYNESSIDWELCYGWGSAEQYKFYANVTFPADWIANNVIKNVTFKIHSPDDFNYLGAGKIQFTQGGKNDVWNFNDLLGQADSYGLVTTEKVRDNGYLITMSGFSPSTPYTDGNKLVLDPTVGEVTWSNSSENVVLAESLGGPLYMNSTCANPVLTCPVFRQSSCSNDGFACGNGTSYGLFSLNDNEFFSSNGYFQFKGVGDGGLLVGSQFPEGWIAVDLHRYTCNTEFAVRDESVTLARTWDGAVYVFAGNSSLNYKFEGVYQKVYENTSVGQTGPRNFTGDLNSSCARYWIWFVNATNVGASTNGPAISEIAYRGTTYGENFTTNGTVLNSSVTNATFGYSYAWTPDFGNATPTLFFNGSPSSRYVGTCTNNTQSVNCSVSVNLSSFNNGTYSYYFRILNWMNDSNLASNFNTSSREVLLADSSSHVTINLFILQPEAQTYYATSKQGIFTFISNNLTAASCNVTNNGVTVYVNGTVLNGTNATFTLSNLNHNTNYNMTVICSNGLDTANKSVSYSIVHFTNTTSAFASNAELTLGNFTMNLTTASEIADVNVVLFYNGVAQPLKSKGSSGVFYNFSWSTLSPLTFVNASVNAYWYVVNVSYANTSVQYFVPMNNTQTLVYSIYPLDMSNFLLNNTEYGFVTPTLIVGDFVNLANLTAWFNATYTNGTATLASVYNVTNSTFNSNKTYSQLAFLGGVQVGNQEARNINGWIQVSYNGSSRNMTDPTFTNKTLQVFKIILTACNTALSSTVAINMSIFNEQNGFAVYNDTIETNYYVWNPVSPDYTRNYAFIMNTSTLKFYNGTCIWPEWANYSIQNNIVYSSAGYQQRQYFLTGQITNETRNVSLYLLPSSSASQVIINVQDENGNAVSNVTIQVLRYFTGNNSFLLVAQTLSDYQGIASTYLEVNDVYYKFILVQNNTVRAEYAPVLIVCSSGVCPPYQVTLKLSELELPHYYIQNGNLIHQCFLNSTSTVLSCTVVDLTGFNNNLKLDVFVMGPLKNTLLGTSSCIGQSCTLTVTLGNLTGKLFTWNLYGVQQGDYVTQIDSGVFDFTNGVFGYSWGQLGLIMGLMIVVLLFFAGAWEPSVAVGLGMVGLIGGWLIGFLPVSIGSLVGMIIVAAMIIYKVRR